MDLFHHIKISTLYHYYNDLKYVHTDVVNLDKFNNFSLKYGDLVDLGKVNALIFGTKNHMDSKPILIAVNIRKADNTLTFNSNIISGEGIYIGLGSPATNLDFKGFDNYTVLTIISNDVIKVDMWN